MELQSAISHGTFQSAMPYAQVASRQGEAEIAGGTRQAALAVEVLWPSSPPGGEPGSTGERRVRGDSPVESEDQSGTRTTHMGGTWSGYPPVGGSWGKNGC